MKTRAGAHHCSGDGGSRKEEHGRLYGVGRRGTRQRRRRLLLYAMKGGAELMSRRRRRARGWRAAARGRVS
jgi:hypothetical protein